MLQINIHCHICFGLRLLPKMLKIQTYLAGESQGREGWCGLLKSGPSVQLNNSFIATNHNEESQRGITTRANLTQGKEKGYINPDKTQMTPALGLCSQDNLSLLGASLSLALGCEAGALPWHH